ncbi:MAG: hypothetical protein ACLPY5_15635 [Candidatus Bathyarchaeia archaeon]
MSVDIRGFLGCKFSVDELPSESSKCAKGSFSSHERQQHIRNDHLQLLDTGIHSDGWDSSSVYAPVRRGLLTPFFRRQILKIQLTDFDKNVRWKRDHEIKIRGLITDKKKRIRFLTLEFTPYRKKAEQCSPSAAIFIDPSLRVVGDLLLVGLRPTYFRYPHDIAWEKRDFKSQKFVEEHLSEEIAESLPREINLKPNQEGVIAVLFTVEGSDTAYITTSEPIPIVRGSKVYIRFIVIGSNFDGVDSRRLYRITFESWDNFNMEPVNFITWLGDLFRHCSHRLIEKRETPLKDHDSQVSQTS